MTFRDYLIWSLIAAMAILPIIVISPTFLWRYRSQMTTDELAEWRKSIRIRTITYLVLTATVLMGLEWVWSIPG